MAAVQEGCLDIQFTPDEIKELITALQFAVTASKLCADQELIKGTYKGAAQMNRITSNSSKLLDVIIAAAQIGVPDSDAIN